ncbi:MAG: HEAT repeat domain-containing protein [Planctomycetota bacterium]
MNTLLRSMVAAALGVAAVVAQAPDAAAALARAQLLEHQEADLGAAEQAYRALLADAGAGPAHGEAALRLGTLLWRLDRKDDGKPFLERAVAAGGTIGAQATAVLQGQGEEGKQAQERLEKARALVERIVDLAWLTDEPRPGAEADQATLQSLQEQLRWLGEAAATALVERLARLQGLSEQQLRTAKGQPLPDMTLARLLWKLGGKAAGDYLTRIADDPNLHLRRFLTQPLRERMVAGDLEPQLVRFARDPDPTNEVWQNVWPAIAGLPIGTPLRLLQDAHPGPRAAALLGLVYYWPNLVPAEQERIVGETSGVIRRSLQDPDPRVSRGAWRLLAAFACAGQSAGRALFLAEAAACPDDVVVNEPANLPGEDALLAALAGAARQLGKKDTRSRPAMQFVSAVLHNHQPMWTQAAVDDVLTLLELGYAAYYRAPQEGWLVHAVRKATPEQLARLLGMLPRVPRVDDTLRELGRMPLPAEVFPSVRALLEACLDDRIPAWITDPRFEERTGRSGRTVRVQQQNTAVTYLLAALVGTRSPAAATWLTAQAAQRPALAYSFAGWLVVLSQAGVTEAAPGLRTLLVWPGTDDGELQPDQRSQIFAELARVGDVGAIPLLPQAYELGLQLTGIRGTGTTFSAAGICFLGDRKDFGRRAPTGPWHGYGDQDLIAAWRTLLESTIADQVWEELLRGNVPQPGPTVTTQSGPNMREFEIPLAVLPLLCKHLPQRWALPSTAEAKNDLYTNVLPAFRRLARTDVEGDNELARALRTLLAADEHDLALYVFASLPADVGVIFADEARLALHRAPSKHWVTYLLRAGIELSADDWRDLLATRDRNSLTSVLKALPPPPAAALRRDVEATLQHDQKEVRIAACQAMQRLYAADAVPGLLPLLQDPDDDVRKAARASLDQLREDHERRTFWADARSGIDLSPASAAAKLLAQAQAGETKDQRLLAIRSLAVLAAAESLPHLIDWTKDADADIATAARTAIAQIHQKAGLPEPAKK